MNSYSFADVSATLVGPSGAIDLGYGAAVAQEGIDIEQTAEKNTMTIGADGKGMHTLNADNSGEITVRLLKVSPINDQLMAAYDEQQASSLLWGQNTITVRQNASGDITVATQVAFKKKPRFQYAKEAGMVEWQFQATEVNTILGTY